MKNLIIALAIFVLSIAAHAGEREFIASLKCDAITFRASGEDASENHGLIWLKVIKKDDKYYLEEYGGHNMVYGYYGAFNGANLVEKPYVRAPAKYKNHLKFDDFDAAFTAGNESGMWGSLVINKDIDGSRGKEGFETDAHYIFKAGDHIGGTIDYSCRPTL